MFALHNSSVSLQAGIATQVPLLFESSKSKHKLQNGWCHTDVFIQSAAPTFIFLQHQTKELRS